MFTFLELISFAYQGHLLALLVRLGAGINRKYLCIKVFQMWPSVPFRFPFAFAF